ncbi:hypothetical protein ACFVAV_19555 [Nocardia sp. NPDC057663]|uniref:hypothetical protein n=1 Tax=Nocardia sp. NPDC057663 TaxID=3346201 RepID=UPI00366FF9AD
MSSLNVDPAALRGTQPSFDSVANTITTGAQALAAVIAAEGECWSKDEVGEAFAKNYTEPRRTRRTRLRHTDRYPPHRRGEPRRRLGIPLSAAQVEFEAPR